MLVVSHLVLVHGVERIGFLTLTFEDEVLCPKEAQRRMNSLLTNALRQRYRDYVCVFERQKSGSIHYHLLVVLEHDIRTGVDPVAIARRDYRSAGRVLRAEWAFWRQTAKKYKFGRCHLMPVRTNEKGMAKYVSKYIAKHIDTREVRDKGVRLVRCSEGAKVGSTRFSWNSPRAQLWRAKLKEFGRRTRCEDGQMSTRFGSKWAYRYADAIMQMPLSRWPSQEAYMKDIERVMEEHNDEEMMRMSRAWNAQKEAAATTTIV